MHYFASIKSGKCDDTVLDEVDIGYSDCDNNCIRIVQWNKDAPQDYIDLTSQMARDLIDALLEWQSH